MIARFLATAAILGCLARAETIDRIAVSVGTDVITESDLVRDLKVAAFLDHKPADLSSAARRQAAARLVDQLLILREAAESHVPLPSTEGQVGRVAPYAAEPGYRESLERYGISEADLGAHLLGGLRTMAFTDLRFRSDVLISPEEARAYYDQLVQKSGSAQAQPSFEASRDQIERLLSDQRVIEELDKWLVTARSGARIAYREKAFE